VTVCLNCTSPDFLSFYISYLFNYLISYYYSYTDDWQIIKKMWPFIGKFVKKTLKTSVQPKINDALPSALTPFQFQTVDVGAVVSTGLFAATDGCIIISMWFTGCLCRLKVPTFVYCHLMFRRQLKTYFLRNIDRDVLSALEIF